MKANALSMLLQISNCDHDAYEILFVFKCERERDDDDAEELSCSDSNKSIIYVNDLLQSLLQHIVMWILGATKESYIF